MTHDDKLGFDLQRVDDGHARTLPLMNILLRRARQR